MLIKQMLRKFRARLVRIYVKLMLWRKRRILERKAGTKFGIEVKIDLFTILEGGNRLGDRVNVQSSNVGFGSYISTDSTLQHSKIGRYCSIGDNVRCGSGTHPVSDFVSTHPAFFSTLGQAGFTFTQTQLFEELPKVKGEDHVVIIGNDVWIGSGVVIMDGIQISDGAVIGANSTVTRDVPPYAVCVGSPARIIKYRFDENQCKWLCQFKWWDRDYAWVAQHAQEFREIEVFCDQFRDGADCSLR